VSVDRAHPPFKEIFNNNVSTVLYGVSISLAAQLGAIAGKLASPVLIKKANNSFRFVKYRGGGSGGGGGGDAKDAKSMEQSCFQSCIQ
jgi:hypothetical protein